MDALTHAVEAFIGRERTNKTKRYSLEAVRLIDANLYAFYRDPSNQKARLAMAIEKTIKEALFYAKTHLDLREEDFDYFQNLLLAHYHLSKPYEGDIDEKAIAAYPLPDPIVDAIIAYDLSQGLDEGAAERDSTYVMGLLTPTPHGTAEKEKALFHRIKELMPDAILRTTLISGFPGETEEDQKETLSFLEEIRFDHLGDFPYSREKGTAAYSFDHQVPKTTKLKRKDEIMLPLPESFDGMSHFEDALELSLKKKHYVLFFPEQAEWWYYRKVRPFKNGAFHYALKYNVPIIPCFITFAPRKKKIDDPEGMYPERMIVHILAPIYPEEGKDFALERERLKATAFNETKECYENVYGIPLRYSQ